MNKMGLNTDTPQDSQSCDNCNGEVACHNCGLFGVLGVLGDLEDTTPEHAQRILKRRQVVAKGENIFRSGQPFHAIYAVKSGSFKSYAYLENGQEQVTGFHFPGDLLGLEAVSSTKYSYSARALEGSSVCELGFEDLELMQDHFHKFQEELILILSNQILRDQRQTGLSIRQSAEERVAAFLMGLSSRLQERELESTEFRLSMSRQDIASYLGLAVETVSRIFKQFQQSGLLTVRSKRIKLVDKASLIEIAQMPQLSS